MSEKGSDPCLNFSVREHMTSEEIVASFDKASATYDQTWKTGNNIHHVIIAEGVADFYRKSNRKGVRIIDVAAGTGLLAEELWKRGFRNIDGLDPSKGMKNEALKKNIYTQYYLEYMDGRPIKDIDTGSYDCLAVAAGFNIGLLPCVALPEMIRQVKIGGLICFGVRDCCFTEIKEFIGRLAPLMSWLEKVGAWSLHDKTQYKEFFENSGPGTVYRYVVKSNSIDTDQVSKLLK